MIILRGIRHIRWRLVQSKITFNASDITPRGGAPPGGGTEVLHVNHIYWFSNHVGYAYITRHHFVSAMMQVHFVQTYAKSHSLASSSPHTSP